MTKVLIVEDSKHKREQIEFEVKSYFKDSLEVDIAETFSAAVKFIYQKKYDFIVIDLMLPRRNGDAEVDISDEIIETIIESELNLSATVVAMSRFVDIVEEKRTGFVNAGIILVYFDDDGQKWKSSLNVCMQRMERRQNFDFVIVCALDKERNAFRSTRCQIGELCLINGLDCLKLSIEGLNGVCVKLPRMGLVDATAITARAIEAFSPSIVAMSGICGGFSDETEIGTIIVSDTCWEHQSGKWAGDVFKLEHYQSSLDNKVRSILSQFIERDKSMLNIKSDIQDNKNLINQEIVLKPTVTGSAVIASETKVEQIKAQHRKVAGLDMEMFGVYRACDLSNRKPCYFGAKTVVDLADSAKGDNYHHYGCIVSARFVTEAMIELHNSL